MVRPCASSALAFASVSNAVSVPRILIREASFIKRTNFERHARSLIKALAIIVCEMIKEKLILGAAQSGVNSSSV